MERIDEIRNEERELMVARACMCYCDDICEKSMSGMCFHKYDHLQQVKNDFKYNECNNLKLLIHEMTK